MSSVASQVEGVNTERKKKQDVDAAFQLRPGAFVNGLSALASCTMAQLWVSYVSHGRKHHTNTKMSW